MNDQKPNNKALNTHFLDELKQARIPLVLNPDGSPWEPACLWLLERSRVKPLKLSSLKSLAQGLRAYNKFLDELEMQWDNFSEDIKYLRPTYFYQTHLRLLVDSGALQRSTGHARLRIVLAFYRFLMQNTQLGFQPKYPPWQEKVACLEPPGCKRLK